MKQTALTSIDSYKISHAEMYPEGTTKVYANFTPRSMTHFNVPAKYKADKKIVWVGIQGFLHELIKIWDDTFFNQDIETVCSEYSEFVAPFCGPNGFNTDRLRELHKLGYLPLQVKSLPEGVRVPIGVPVLTITNTVASAFWLPNFLETWLSTELWKASTSATMALVYRKIIDAYADETGGNKDFVQFQGHDFSVRGMSGYADSAKSGMGHLLSFTGTDNLPAVKYINDYYEGKSTFVGCSVPASEHSVMSTTTKEEELDTYRRLLDKYPSGVVSLVSDTYDFFQVITTYAAILKDQILNRIPDSLGLAKVVFRPDCYDEETQIFTNSGWKYFKDLANNDIVAQVLDDNSYEFVLPTEIINQSYQGKMYQFSDHHGKVDLLVTPNHRMVINANGKDKIVDAEKMLNTGHHYQKMYRSAKSKTFGLKLSNLDRLKIAFQADGSFCTDMKTSIRFSFSKSRKIDRMKNLLDKLVTESNVDKYSTYDLADGKVEFNIKISSDLFIKDFSWVDISNLDSNWAIEFIEELSHWDSCIRNSNRIKFDTTNANVISIVEYIAISAGYGIYISEYDDNRSELFNKVYTAHIMKNNMVGGQSWIKSEIDYVGRVYCVKVPSGKVLVKRNQCTLVSGNSGDPVEIICGTEIETLNLLEQDYDNLEKIGNWAKDSIIDRVDYETAHGKAGEDYPEDIFRVGDKYYKVKIEIQWNRYDKQYYYMDDWDVISVEEVTLTPEQKGAVQCLDEIFGTTTNNKGFKTLNQRVGLIYGDSITVERCEAILMRLKAKGYASDNIVFGIGSYTYQYQTRDTLGFAMKATYRETNGDAVEIFKDPKTDSGTKKSSKGLLMVNKVDDEYVLHSQVSNMQEGLGELRTVFLDGDIVYNDSIETIRNRLVNSK